MSRLKLFAMWQRRNPLLEEYRQQWHNDVNEKWYAGQNCERQSDRRAARKAHGFFIVFLALLDYREEKSEKSSGN